MHSVTKLRFVQNKYRVENSIQPLKTSSIRLSRVRFDNSVQHKFELIFMKSILM